MLSRIFNKQRQQAISIVCDCLQNSMAYEAARDMLGTYGVTGFTWELAQFTPGRNKLTFRFQATAKQYKNILTGMEYFSASRFPIFQY